MFIVLEGCDGSGKSTQARLLEESLKEKGFKTVLTREPGGSPFAEDTRNLIFQSKGIDYMVELLLFNAARRDHLQKVVLPSIQNGSIVICDRYIGSTFAYQCSGFELTDDYINKLEDRVILEKQIELLHKTFCFNKQPDITIYLDIDPIEGLKRSNRHNNIETLFENKGLEFQKAVHKNYVRFMETIPDHKKIHIQTLLPHDSKQEDEILKEIMTKLHYQLKLLA